MRFMPVWDDILIPLYIDPGVKILYDIFTQGQNIITIYIDPIRDILTSPQKYKKMSYWLCIITRYDILYDYVIYM